MRDIKISNLLYRVAKEVRLSTGDVPLDFYEQYDSLSIRGVPTTLQLIAFRDRVVEAALRKEERRIHNLQPSPVSIEVLGGLDGALERLGWGKK